MEPFGGGGGLTLPTDFRVVEFAVFDVAQCVFGFWGLNSYPSSSSNLTAAFLVRSERSIGSQWVLTRSNNYFIVGEANKSTLYPLK